MRSNNRKLNALRPIKFEMGYLKNHEGSVLVSWGNTKVICVATSELKVPPHRVDIGGWLSAEYNMLPGSTQMRKQRSFSKGSDGRSVEISRLIGRSLRQAINLNKIGQRTILIDCDVIEADAGTRCAAITGGFLALCGHIAFLIKSGQLKMLNIEDIIIRSIAAVSLGIVNNNILCDIDLKEDNKALVDCNLIGSENHQIIEFQCSAEQRPLNKDELDRILAMGQEAISLLISEELKVLSSQCGIIFHRT